MQFINFQKTYDNVINKIILFIMRIYISDNEYKNKILLLLLNCYRARIEGKMVVSIKEKYHNEE